MEEKKKWYANKKVLVILIAVLVVAIVGMSFAYYFAILRGDNVNIAKTGSASLIYTEPAEGIEISQMSDYDGMTNTKSYDFSVTGRSDGDAKLYYGIYAEEEEGNTIDASKVKVYLTDENDIPYEGYITDIVETFIYDPNGEYVWADHGVDYSLEYNYNGNQGTKTGRGYSTEDVLYSTYALDILGLDEGEKFYISKWDYNYEIGEWADVCYEYNSPFYYYDDYQEQDEGPMMFSSVKGKIVDSSLCNAKVDYYYDDEVGEGYDVLVDNDDEIIVKANTSENFKVSGYDEEDEFYEKTYESKYDFFEEMSGSSDYYVKRVYGFDGFYTDFFYDVFDNINELPFYCVNTVDDVVDDSNCDNAYIEVFGLANPEVLSEKWETFESYLEVNNLSNHIYVGDFTFDNGKIAPLNGKGYGYLYEYRHYQNPHQYKLRYWVSNDGASGEDSDVPQESTTTSEGNTHTVEFGSGGVFKFKVNVYARQG